MLIVEVVKGNSSDLCRVYDTDDYTFEAVSRSKIKQLYLARPELFVNVKYSKTRNKIGVLQKSDLKDNSFLPEFITIDANTHIWVSKSLQRLVVFNYEMCYVSDENSEITGYPVPIVLENNLMLRYLRNGVLGGSPSLIYIGDYDYTTLRRALTITGDKLISKCCTDVHKMYSTLNIIAGVPDATELTRMRILG